ncbi:MAG: tRNA (adenosine(37)-N6)-threonylcarbamoyltransferase complex ATPase subunit type 1 TsaE [Phycisphaerales bacterium]|nr:tRNA (adenosine(37)-N6)-threonylcarbamoyltransferase complex ATPase subunit type 1 TsaE [Phycisphaerales bacterium]
MLAEGWTAEITTASPAETERLGERIGRALRPGDLALLHGELGAGKTCLVRGVARGMGLDPAGVNSPTFVVVNEYGPTPRGGRLLHMDAYRLRAPEDLDALGLDESRTGAAMVVEWAERVASGLGPAIVEIWMSHEGGERRRVRLRGPDLEWRAALGDLD